MRREQADLYYLVENSDGFERPIRMGTEEELAVERENLIVENSFIAERMPGGQTVGYYTVPKGEWDSQHCPLIPVDFS
jgi:hypothetical protein